jgi:hypothetical protein
VSKAARRARSGRRNTYFVRVSQTALEEGCLNTMASLLVTTIEATGPAEDLERVRAAIEESAIELGNGVECLKRYYLDREKWATAFPEWGNCMDLGRLESCYPTKHLNPDALRPHHSTQDDGRPVRIADGVLIIRTETNWTPPVGFAQRLGDLFPSLEIVGASLELTNGIFERWRSHGGQTELLERRESAFVGEAIVEWEKDDRVWMWANEREADIRMLHTFLELDVANGADSEDLFTACRLAYDALAFPHDSIRAEANSYAYNLAGTISEYRHALVRRPELTSTESAETTEHDPLDELLGEVAHDDLTGDISTPKRASAPDNEAATDTGANDGSHR